MTSQLSRQSKAQSIPDYFSVNIVPHATIIITSGGRGSPITDIPYCYLLGKGCIIVEERIQKGSGHLPEFDECNDILYSLTRR